MMASGSRIRLARSKRRAQLAAHDWRAAQATPPAFTRQRPPTAALKPDEVLALQRLVGNRAVQRLTGRVQRLPVSDVPGSAALLGEMPPPEPVNPDPLDDPAFVNSTIESLPAIVGRQIEENIRIPKKLDEKAKARIEDEKLQSRRDFLLGMQKYIGALDDVIAHYRAIRKAKVPGEVWLHESAASRLEKVAEKLGAMGAVMPYSDVGLGLRNRFRPHDVRPTGLMAHPCGYAIDYRPNDNPMITDPRLVKLLDMQTKGASHMKLGEHSSYGKRRGLIKEMAGQTLAGGIDPKSETGKKAEAFFGRFKAEYDRLVEASRNLTTNLPPGIQELKAVRENLKKNANESAALAKLKGKKKKGKEADPELTAQETKLLEEKTALEARLAALKADLPKVFEPWIAQIRDEMKKIEDGVKKADPTVDLSSMPGRQELAKQKREAEKNRRQAEAKRKKAERGLGTVKAKIEKETQRSAAGEASIRKLTADIETLNAGAAKPQTPKQKKQTADKVARLKGRIEKEVKQKEVRDKLLATLREAETKAAVEAEGHRKNETAAAETLQRITRMEGFLDEKKEWDVLKSLEQGLGDEKFVFQGEREAKNPAVMQLLEKGFVNPDKEAAPGETPDSRKHGFNFTFMKVMAEYGFDLGIAWNPGSLDTMHFELIEGVERIEKPPKE